MTSIFKDLFKYAFDLLPDYELELGVISNSTKRLIDNKSGITNAEILFINEYGSPLHHIPSRPVLQYTINYVENELLNEAIDDCLNKYLESNFDKKVIDIRLQQLGMEMESYARDIIYNNDGTFKDNAPSTAKLKWKKQHKSKSKKWIWPEGNHPLFDTGQLARSITSRLVKR